MTPEEMCKDYAEANVKMFMFTYNNLIKKGFSRDESVKTATDLVAASIRCQGNYCV